MSIILFLMSLLSVPSLGEVKHITVNTPLRVKQSDTWNYYLLPLGIISTQYWSVSISVVHSTCQVALAIQTNGEPLWLNNNFSAQYVDTSSWELNSTTHVLFFTPQSLGNVQDVYAGVYLFSNTSQVTYDILLASSRSPYCPSNCSNAGNCSEGICNCQPGFVGIDCRFPTLSVELETGPRNLLIGKGEWKLVTTNGKNLCNLYEASVSMTATVLSSSPDLYLFLSTGIPGYHLDSGDLFPGFQYSSEKREMTVSGAVTLSLDLYSHTNIIYMSLYNAAEYDTNVVVTAGSGTDSTSGTGQNLPLIAGIGGFFAIALLGVVVGCTVFVCKRRQIHRTVEQGIESRGIPQAKVEGMFPSRRFSQIAAFHVADTCAVCLERFKADSDIRVLPCRHVYHTPCIDLWFRDKNVRLIQICCLCKLDCENFSEEAEAETGTCEAQFQKQIPGLQIENLDETHDEPVRNLHARSILNTNKGK